MLRAMRRDMALGSGGEGNQLRRGHQQRLGPDRNAHQLRGGDVVHRDDVQCPRGPGAVHRGQRVGGILHLPAIVDHLAGVQVGRHHRRDRHDTGQRDHRHCAPAAPSEKRADHSRVTAAVPVRQ